jgi:plastocyanin
VVRLQNVSIHPARLTIRAGDRVTWRFLDAPATEHTVTPERRPGGLSFKGTGAHFSGSYSATFARRGTYYYQCLIHPGMQGRIVVR